MGMARLFGLYGEFCATHPWEVIVTVITPTVCLLTVDRPTPAPPTIRPCAGCLEESFRAVDVVVMTVIRCAAVLYTLHQFRSLHRLGSRYILGVAVLFALFSSVVFTTTLLNLLRIELVDLKDAFFFFMLLIDLSKAAKLAQYALTATTQEEISTKIARGMSVLGPTLTLDTIVETLVIGVGTLSGVRRLETLSYFACLSALVNYAVFMTFYPACLSLMLELSRVWNYYGERCTYVTKMLSEENEKSNPAVQRVKLIMSVGLLVVHLESRYLLNMRHSSGEVLINEALNATEWQIDDDGIYSYVLRQFVLGVEHLVILIVVATTLLVRFVLYAPEAPAIEYAKLDVTEEVERTVVSQYSEKHVQTSSEDLECSDHSQRSLEQCLQVYRNGGSGLTDEEVVLLVETKHIPAYNLEKALDDYERGVRIRRKLIRNSVCNPDAFSTLPYKEYDYSKVMGVCCENVIGYVPIPLGVAGPLLVDGERFYVPMATTEGCLIASTNRGCRAVELCGVRSRLLSDGMTRGPVLRFPSIAKASEAAAWIDSLDGFSALKREFDATSRFARLQRIGARVAGRYLYVRFVAGTGDAMGMNMLSKGTEKALHCMRSQFSEMEVLSVSGNYCTDKKAAAINWLEGRGKSVVCEAIVPGDVVRRVLKTTSAALVELNIAKNMVGSAMAGSVGGFNAHAANIVTAIYIATGQDPAQNVASSNCITLMETWGEDNKDLHISCTMPSVELGTIGGGTALPAQSACLEMLGVRGANGATPGENARKLSRIVCATVLAGELSLMAALAAGHLVQSHLQLNRSCDGSRSKTNDA